MVQWSWFARVNALCNLLHKKSREVAASLQGQFLSRCCFMQNLESRSSTNATTIAVAEMTMESGWRVEKKRFCIVFWLTRRLRVCWKKCVLGHPIAQAASYCLLPDKLWLQASKNAFKVGSVKFANALSVSLPSSSIVKKVCTGNKSSQGT